MVISRRKTGAKGTADARNSAGGKAPDGHVAAAATDLLSWEFLVTEGHVLAARLRYARPYIVGAGLLFLIIGIWLTSAGLHGFGQQQVAQIRDELLTDDVTEAKKPALDAFNGLPAPNVLRSEVGNIAPATQLPEVIKAVLASLNSRNALPESQIKFQRMAPGEFWGKEWPHTVLAFTSAPGLYVIGAVVNEGTVRLPFIGRWLGAFRKFNKGWEYASIQGPGFEYVAGFPVVSVSDIPLTLQPVLPKGNTSDGRSQP